MFNMVSNTPFAIAPKQILVIWYRPQISLLIILAEFKPIN